MMDVAANLRLGLRSNKRVGEGRGRLLYEITSMLKLTNAVSPLRVGRVKFLRWACPAQGFFATRRRPEALRAWRLSFSFVSALGSGVGDSWVAGCRWVDGWRGLGLWPLPRDHLGSVKRGFRSLGTDPT